MRINWTVSGVLAAVAALCLLNGCNSGKAREAADVMAGGDSERGRAAIAKYGCGSCHTIAGIRGARGQVGPPLTGIGNRMFVAGVLPNTPENLERWIRNPKQVDEKTAMPVLGIDAQEAADIGAFLYSTK